MLKLHAAVSEGPLRDAIGGRTAKQIGKALAAMVGVELDGLVIEKIKKEGKGRIWVLRPVGR